MTENNRVRTASRKGDGETGKTAGESSNRASSRAARRPRKDGGLMETVTTVFWALVIALGIRTFAYEPFSIPSGSMIPTLLVGDYLFVSKLSYGYSRYSFPLDLPLVDGRILSDTPERGDVAVFRKPTDTDIDFIKRIVGLPGDRIQMKQGVLHINGDPVGRRRVEDYVYDDGYMAGRSVTQFAETLPNDAEHMIIEAQGDRGPLDNTPEMTVPAGHYFAMGDNRDSSQDSRVLNSVGFVPHENLIGRASFIFFSIGSDWSWTEFWKWPGQVRFGRLFNGID